MKSKKIKETRPLFHVDDVVYRKDLPYSEPYRITLIWMKYIESKVVHINIKQPKLLLF